MLAVSSIEELQLAPLQMSNADKVMHTVEYAIWALFFLLMLKQENRIKTFAQANVSLLIFGGSLAILDEIHQGFIKGRKCGLTDLLADMIGIALVSVISYIVYKRKNKGLILTRKHKL